MTTTQRLRDAPFILTLALLTAALAPAAWAQGGHGPVFGLATPTLPQGAWNADLTVMSAARSGRAWMVSETIRYGLTPDLQLNLSVPQRLERAGAPLRTRIGTMMGGMGTAELSVFWRPHVQYPGVGKRFESTLMLGALYPVVPRPVGADVGPGFHAAAVTGYASRTIYAWAGAGFQRHFEKNGGRPGDLRYLSAVFAWRPPIFQGDYPKPDWRIFVESLAEFIGPDRVQDGSVEASGGRQLFVGPTLLGLYRRWGLGVGVLLPVYQKHRDLPADEGARYVANLSYWF